MQISIIFALYRLFQTAALPVLLLYALWRGAKDRRYFVGLGERFGALPELFQRTARDSVWLHAVSVGEVLSAVELIGRLRRELPGAPVFVSCTTVAGRDAAGRKLDGLVDGVFYAPVDYVFAVRRVLRRIRPAVLIVLETEIWPNLYREVVRSGCGLVVINGRISDLAIASYQRWARVFTHVLSLPDEILVQSELQRERYMLSGAPAHRVRVGGNLKYDFDVSSARLAEPVRDWLGQGSRPLWVAASTVEPEFVGDTDEDDAVIAAYRSLPSLRLIVAPRRPERFEVVAAKLHDAGIRFARRSHLPANADAPVLLLDSIGELGAVFPHADIVFMGGTLAHRGGHNVLEPALSGNPVVVGPHLENFAEVQAKFRAAKAFLEIGDAADLQGAISSLLTDTARARDLGEKARKVAEGERGATEVAVAAILNARWSAVPRRVLHGPLKPWLILLSWIWIAGGCAKRSLTRARSLPHPVVSIGGLAMGGAGKTPVVRALARVLHSGGWRPAVLTRGYRRERNESVTILPAGSSADVALTGDEAQLILRDGAAHVGIGADRWRVGMSLAKELRPDMFILDDGFQHVRVERDLNIVVLDGIDPFAGGSVFPAGRLREPLSALARAHLIVISRAEGRRFDGPIRLIRQFNLQAPILLCETKISLPSELTPGGKVGAFCGIGNPEAFRQTLLRAGCEVVCWRAFPDHYRFSQSEIEGILRMALASGATAVATTEKDAVRLPHRVVFRDIPVVALPIDIHVTDIRL